MLTLPSPTIAERVLAGSPSARPCQPKCHGIPTRWTVCPASFRTGIREVTSTRASTSPRAVRSVAQPPFSIPVSAASAGLISTNPSGWSSASQGRVSCPTHGVVVAAVPWARPGARFTTAFEDTAAWLVCHATLSVVAVLLRIAWRSVSGILTRVVADRAGQTDRLAGLRRIGIDEISYRKGQRYLLVVVDHDSGWLVWAGKDRTAATLRRFFDELGAQRAAALTHVSADGAEWIHTVVAERAPRAVLCLDAFHVVAWASKALATLW